MKSEDKIVIKFESGRESQYTFESWSSSGVLVVDHEGHRLHLPFRIITNINPAPVPTILERFAEMNPGDMVTLYRPDQPDEADRTLIKGKDENVYSIPNAGPINAQSDLWNRWAVR